MKTINAFEDDGGCRESPRLLRPVPKVEKQERAAGEVQFRLYGEEVVHKTVTASGTCGRVYLPLGWVGKRVKIIRVD